MKPDLVSPNKTRYLWKYLSLQKFIFLLKTSSLYFCRLDMLPDKLEGTPLGVLERRYWENEKSEEYKNKNMKIASRSQITPRDLESLMKFDDIIDEEKSKKTQYVNSWFACDRESIAMWRLYSHTDSIALRVNSDIFIDLFNESLEQFIISNGNKHIVIGDYVSYYNLIPFDPNEKIFVKYNALKKDRAYSHEKEYRLLIVDIGISEDIAGLKLSVPKLNDSEISIITNPYMSEWEFQNIQYLIDMFDFKAKVLKSEIKQYI